MENLQDLIAAVKQHNADVGLAFDGDADRLGVVTNTGEVIWPDRQMILFAEDILQRHPGATIIYDVKCTRYLAESIRQSGGEPIMWKTGHSLIKNKMQQTGALLAGEMSGHLFFKERWFGFDDGLYAGVRLLEILANTSATIQQIFAGIPNSINTPELKLAVADERKFGLMEEIAQVVNFADATVNTIDGIRVDFADGWGLVRPSNTTPYLVMRFEADNEKALKRIQQQFRELLLGVDASLMLPF